MGRTLLLGLLLAWLVAGPPAGAKDPQRGVSVMPSVSAGSVPITGEYWALIIGIDKYQHAAKLESAVKDAKGVRDVLIERYGFKKERMMELFNEQATRTKIEHALFTLGRQAGKDDSVFIYYAGHGQYDEEGRLGWWVPVEAEPREPGTFLMDVSILNYVKGMKAKHVYLVADSCFSGTLFGTRALPPLNDQFYARLYAKPSRWGLTSGGTEPVADQGRNGHSIFAYYFITLLKENTDPYLVPSHIFDQSAPLIANNADQTPRSEPLKGAGDDGGQFVFRLAAVAGAPAAPRRPAPALSEAQPPKDVDVSGYDALEVKAQYAEKREQAWAKVQRFAGRTAVKRQDRLEALEKFLADFPDDNPHVGEVEALKQRINAEMQVASGPSYSTPKEAGREITGRDGAPMVLVPEGEFVFGDKFSSKRLMLPAFYMDRYEVTTSRYANFMQSTGRRAPERWNEASLVNDGDRPVIGVDWYDADAYCRYYGKRLPTEQEWEKAARGTDGREYPWGNEKPTPQHANMDFDPSMDPFNSQTGRHWQGYATLTPVGKYEAGKSPYGLYDMVGNVEEWTSSDFPGSSDGAKVVRGEGWYFHVRFSEQWMNQGARLLRIRDYNLGFRCVQDAQ